MKKLPSATTATGTTGVVFTVVVLLRGEEKECYKNSKKIYFALSFAK